MAVYAFRAKDETGALVTSSVEAVSRVEALGVLRRRGLTVVSLFERADRGAAAGARPAERRRGVSFLKLARVSLRDRAVVCRQLAISVSAGVALRDALESLAEDCDNPELERVLKRVTSDLHDGRTFSQAAAEHGHVFGSLFVALVRSAEESGSMTEALEQLAMMFERSERLARRIRSITAYPTFVAGFFLIACSVMTFFVLPKFQAVFSSFQARLPLLTRIVFRINRALIDHAPVILGVSVAVVVALVIYGRTPGGRVRVDGLKLRLPMFGDWLRKLAVARFCRNLAVMTKGGVPIAQGLEVAADVCGNLVMERALFRVRDEIVTGASISDSLQGTGAFPRLVIRMVSVGESSGRLPEVLERVSQGYEDEVEGSIMVATSLFEPLVISVFGAVILVLVLAIYLPVFTIATAVK